MAAIAATSMSVRRVVADDTIAGLVAHAAEKNAAFMRGDMERWSRLARIAPDFTLMQPFGGPASHGFDNSPKRLAELARTFRNGQTELEVAQAYAAENFAVLVMIERQVAEVGGLPSQDWSLRVTEVYPVLFGDIPEKLWRGEACRSAEHFRDAHRYCWPDYNLTDDFEMIATHFELVEIINP